MTTQGEALSDALRLSRLARDTTTQFNVNARTKNLTQKNCSDSDGKRNSASEISCCLCEVRDRVRLRSVRTASTESGWRVSLTAEAALFVRIEVREPATAHTETQHNTEPGTDMLQCACVESNLKHTRNLELVITSEPQP